MSSRWRALRTQAEDEVTVLRRELDIQLMRFSKRARTMSVAEFTNDYCGSLLLASASKPPSSSVLAAYETSTQAQRMTAPRSALKQAPSVLSTPRHAATAAALQQQVGATPLSGEDNAFEIVFCFQFS